MARSKARQRCGLPAKQRIPPLRLHQQAKYQSDYADDHRMSFMPAVFSISGRIDAEFLRLLFYHAHCDSEEFFRLTGQLAQPNQDYV